MKTISFSSELLKPFLWCHFNKFLTDQILNNFCSSWTTFAVWSSVSSQKWHFFSAIWLVKWGENMHHLYQFSCHLSFVCYSFFHQTSPESTSLVVVLSNPSKRILSISFIVHDHIITCHFTKLWQSSCYSIIAKQWRSEARCCNSFIVLMIGLRAAITLFMSFNFESCLILLISDNFFLRSSFVSP